MPNTEHDLAMFAYRKLGEIIGDFTPATEFGLQEYCELTADIII